MRLFNLIREFIKCIADSATDTMYMDSGAIRFMLENDSMW